jgi:hypothetical protein
MAEHRTAEQLTAGQLTDRYERDLQRRHEQRGSAPLAVGAALRSALRRFQLQAGLAPRLGLRRNSVRWSRLGRWMPPPSPDEP